MNRGHPRSRGRHASGLAAIALTDIPISHEEGTGPEDMVLGQERVQQARPRLLDLTTQRKRDATLAVQPGSGGPRPRCSSQALVVGRRRSGVGAALVALFGASTPWASTGGNTRAQESWSGRPRSRRRRHGPATELPSHHGRIGIDGRLLALAVHQRVVSAQIEAKLRPGPGPTITYQPCGTSPVDISIVTSDLSYG